MGRCKKCGGKGYIEIEPTIAAYSEHGDREREACPDCYVNPETEGLVYLFCGDWEWTDFTPIKREMLKRKASIKLLVQGGCRGADKIAQTLAHNHGIPCKTEEAKWHRDGKAAGPIRNQKMLDKYDPDVVLAFHKDIKRSKGTKDMVDRARKHGCIVKVFDK